MSTKIYSGFAQVIQSPLSTRLATDQREEFCEHDYIPAFVDSYRLFRLREDLDTVSVFKEYVRNYSGPKTYFNVPCTIHCSNGVPCRLRNSIMVSADGACRNNGQPGAQASVAVFFKNDSPFNEAHVLPERDPTSQRAELHAGITALRAAGTLLLDPIPKDFEGMERPNLIVLKTDSNYLVKGITEYIFKWRENGWLNARGLPVVNGALFRRLDELVNRIEKHTAATVKFFHVPRELNPGADSLANQVLDDWEEVARERRRVVKSGRINGDF